ncbi:para-aminobenzoate synthase component I [Salmonella sp. NCTC 11881]|nr:para-aminobenzoate synthase component I [Salmonella sp. NCTC 11881]
MMKTLSPTVITLPWRPDAAEHYFAPVNHLPWAMLLHSGDAIHPYNRFDILVADPVTTLTTRAQETTVCTARTTTVTLDDPLHVLQTQLEALPFHPQPDPDLPFQGGALGLFGYDLGRRFEIFARYCRARYRFTRYGDWPLRLGADCRSPKNRWCR